MHKIDAIRSKLKGMEEADMIIALSSGSLSGEIMDCSKRLVDMIPMYSKFPDLIFMSLIPCNKRFLFEDGSDLKAVYNDCVRPLITH